MNWTTELLKGLGTAESSTHDIFTQFLGGASGSDVDVAQSAADVAQAQAEAAASTAEGYSDAAKYAAVGLALLAVGLVIAAAVRAK